MSTLQGTTIKNTGYLDKVYFNTSIPTEEVIDILEKLTYTSGSYDVCYGTNGVRVNIAKHDSYYSIACAKDKFYDMPFNTDPQYVNEIAGIVSTGWKTSFDNEGFGNPFEFNAELSSTDSVGNTVGSQNELLKNLISSTPFEAITLDEFLTDLAESIRYVKGTEEKVNAQNYSSEIRKFKGGTGSSTPVDNGPIYEGKYRVRYFDTDGTILKIEYVESGGKTTPPTAPSYDPEYLIFAEWNYDTDNYIVEQPTDIGAIYDTVDDVTYMFCRFTTNTGLNPTLAITGATSIDWGDGTVDTNLSHTYANEGEYLIKISGSIIFSESSSSYLLGSMKLNNALSKIYLSNKIEGIPSTKFVNCYSLYICSLSKNIKTIGNFNRCHKLSNLNIPNGIAQLGSFTSCTSLKTITIPNSVINISQFYSCYSLIDITLPSFLTAISNSLFYYCQSLKSVFLPQSIKSIGSNAFDSCFPLTNYFIDCDTVPTLSNTNAFSSINQSTIFWVKDSIIEQLKTATNWSTYASYMKPLSWYPSLTTPNA